MDFNGELDRYHRNFLQYVLTGEEKYKVAYEKAQTNLNTFLQSEPSKPIPKPIPKPKTPELVQGIVPPPTNWQYWVAVGLAGVAAILSVF